MTSIFPPLAQQPNAGQARLIIEVSRSHTMTLDSRKDSSEEGIAPTQKPLPENTRHSHETRLPSATPTCKRPQNFALDRSAIGICTVVSITCRKCTIFFFWYSATSLGRLLGFQEVKAPESSRHSEL